MDFFRDVDLEKCAAIQNRLAEISITDPEGMYLKLTSSMLQQLLDAGVLDYYKECANGYLTAIFTLEDAFFYKYRYVRFIFPHLNMTIRKDEDNKNTFMAEHTGPVDEESSSDTTDLSEPDETETCCGFKRRYERDDTTERDDIKARATARLCHICGKHFTHERFSECECGCFFEQRERIAHLLLVKTRTVFGMSEETQKRLADAGCRIMQSLTVLGVVYDLNRPSFYWLKMKYKRDRKTTQLQMGRKKVSVNFFHELYFSSLPPLLMTGDLLTAYARLEFLRLIVHGTNDYESRRGRFSIFLDLLEEYYPLHYEKFVHYVNSFPRFPLYSMAARDYDRRSKKRTEFLKSVRSHLWRPGGELAKRLESLCH